MRGVYLHVAPFIEHAHHSVLDLQHVSPHTNFAHITIKEGLSQPHPFGVLVADNRLQLLVVSDEDHVLCQSNGNHALWLSGHRTLINNAVGWSDTPHDAVAGGLIAGAQNYVHIVLQDGNLSAVDQRRISYTVSDAGDLTFLVQLCKLHIHYSNSGFLFANKMVQSVFSVLRIALCT